MPAFILRKLDPIFWARVQAKAAREGTTVKALILKLLTQWLGVLLLAGLTSGCMEPYTAPPLSPTTVAPAPVPTPTPTLPIAPLSVALSIGVATPEAGDRISFVASSSTAITRADWAFGNGATQQTSRGDTAYAYPATGTFVAQVTISASDGRTATDHATVTVRRRDTPPSDGDPDPDPVPNTSGFAASVACAPKAAGTATPCHATVSYDGVVQPSGTITSVDWDFGDGITLATTVPVASRGYAGAGTYHVFADVTATLPPPPTGPGGVDHRLVSTTITIP